ncbi:alpha amylase catalytic region [Nitrospirillum viridazoti Y2]|uniref:Glycosidase n=1 Tax=Nitrospirillum amazonense TaxID=28077 RepID=A0A560II88_9PROT|nr:alpha-amylase family glycosyl hydrolase [Nitrospirillum amazonense]EGY02579.1 alpha amylase catalytic region [Nitrospirillum amazonense Y2]TWB56500.1 glycosidase [Nitrospirillum amazonense]
MTPFSRRLALLATTMIIAAGTLLSAGVSPARAADYRDRLAEDEVVYFLLPDRFDNADTTNDTGGLGGGRGGDRSVTGYDPTDSGYYHGGDLKGLIRRLDYIQGLGVTALWVGPVFRNKAVQGAPGHQSAGYHGYWITDFTHVDPHLGTDDDFKALVDAAHARGMKVYLDIVINHTADVIQYKECAPENGRGKPCPYRSKADYPYTRKGGPAGPAINAGFQGDEVRTEENFARLTDPAYAYTPFVPEAERHVKAPDWLNDPRYYHNRGDSTFKGESSLYGDFGGLDDVMTEHPAVVRGFIDIYGAWIDRYGIDGYRIDTTRHVNPEFWQAFVPAMLERAKSRGILHFHIFGEVADTDGRVAVLARHTRVDKLPAVLDFAFRRAVVDTVAGTKGTDRLALMLDGDALYEGGEDAARQLPTFVSNHDHGRFAYFARRAFPQAGEDEILKRVILANALMFTQRGVPVVYSGDEQGFSGGEDRAGREDMFGSRVASYNAERLVGTTATTATPSFNPNHPLYKALAEMARLREAEPALRHGRSVVRYAGEKPGLFAVSRIDPATGREVLVAVNTGTQPVSAQVEVGSQWTTFTALHGSCGRAPTAPGSYAVQLAPLDYVVCASGEAS